MFRGRPNGKCLRLRYPRDTTHPQNTHSFVAAGLLSYGGERVCRTPPLQTTSISPAQKQTATLSASVCLLCRLLQAEPELSRSCCQAVNHFFSPAKLSVAVATLEHKFFLGGRGGVGGGLGVQDQGRGRTDS